MSLETLTLDQAFVQKLDSGLLDVVFVWTKSILKVTSKIAWALFWSNSRPTGSEPLVDWYPVFNDPTIFSSSTQRLA